MFLAKGKMFLAKGAFQLMQHLCTAAPLVIYVSKVVIPYMELCRKCTMLPSLWKANLRHMIEYKEKNSKENWSRCSKFKSAIFNTLINFPNLLSAPCCTTFYIQYAISFFHALIANCTSISPGHTLQCYTPAMVCSKRAAMPKNRMRCAAIESSTCSIFLSQFWNISAIYYAIYMRFTAF